jgi:hypothetical protein
MQFTKVFKDYDFSPDEIKIYMIMQEYQRVSIDKGKFITMFKKDVDPRTARYWKAFHKFYNEFKTKLIDWPLYFLAQFETFGVKGQKFVPNFLCTKASYDRYRKFLKVFKIKTDVEETTKKEMARSIFMSHKFILKWLESNGMRTDNYEPFFTYKEEFDDAFPNCYKFINTNVINRLYLSVSKSFGVLVEEITDRDVLCEMITPEEIIRNRKRVLSDERILEYSKRTMKDEFDITWKVK